MSASQRRRPAPLTPERAWDYALWLLGRQAYSAAELERRLRRRHLSATESARIVARLQDLQLLDDARYAEAYVHARRHARGVAALRHELRRKGVAEHHVEAALGEAGEPDQVAAAADLLEARAWRFADAADTDPARARRGRARAAAFLARRGFAPDVVHEALERAWSDDG